LNLILKGAIIFIGNHSINPSNQRDGIQIPTNSDTYLSISRDFVKRLENPYGDCLRDFSQISSSFYNAFVEVNRTYRQKDCFDMIIQQFIVNECKCNINFIPKMNKSVNYCNTVSEIECGLASFGSISKNFIDDNIYLCPPECDTIDIKSSMSTTHPFNPTSIENLRNHSVVQSYYPKELNISYEELANSIVSLTIYYNELRYVEIVEIPDYTILNLISNIGGTLSLFLGISLLTFIEIIDLFVQIVYSLTESKTIYPIK
jgi:hypothetical protein